jgi:hypothetical protein
MKIKLPNFLIAGAAKSGTTSLYNYLRQHPQIFMAKKKEPKFITSQFLQFPFKGPGDELVEKGIIKSFQEYQKLFENVNNEIAIGEASADTLYYYRNTIKVIKKYLGNPKIIIILRNPIERAYSAYTHLVRDNREYLSFEKALEQEEYRKKNNWEFIWFYKSVGFYYQQVKAFIDNFDLVKIYLYEDLKENPLALIQDIFRFLEVDDNFFPDLNTIYNVSGIPKNKWLHEFLTKQNYIKLILKPFVKFFISENKRRKIVEKIRTKNLQKIPMKLETRDYLKNIYKKDILKLQDLIKRDLSCWLRL